MSISLAILFFKSISSRKNWQGGGKLLQLKWYRYNNSYAYDPCYYCLGPMTFGDLPNIGEDQKKVLPS